MPIRTEIHDLAFFTPTPLGRVADGAFFLHQGELAKRFTLNNYQCWALFSGERGLLFTNYEPDRMEHRNAFVLTLREDLAARIEPLAPLVRRARVANPNGKFLITPEQMGVCMSGIDDADQARDPGRIVVDILGPTGVFHEGDFLWAVDQWRIDWINRLGSPVVSLVSELLT
jgi:hypothetical protein